MFVVFVKIDLHVQGGTFFMRAWALEPTWSQQQSPIVEVRSEKEKLLLSQTNRKNQRRQTGRRKISCFI